MTQIKKLGDTGTQEVLAAKHNTTQPQISKWVKAGVIVIDGELYAPIKRRK